MKYTVNVLYHKAFDKDIIVHAKSEAEAEAKAVEKVESWNNVEVAEATYVQLVED